MTRRLTMLVAAAGYGKSTLLAAWVAAAGGRLHRLGSPDRDLPRLVAAVAEATVPDQAKALAAAAIGPNGERDDPKLAGHIAGMITDLLTQRLRRDVVLALDDVEAIADAPASVRFIESLVRTAPRRLHVVLAGRETLPFSTARLTDLLTFDATDLALTPDETETWLRVALGEAAASLAPQLHAACSGWPVALRAAIDVLSRTEPSLWGMRCAELADSLASPQELVREAVAALPPPTRQLLRAAVILPVLTDDLAAAFGAQPGTLSRLHSRGLFLETTFSGYRLTPLTRRVLAQDFPVGRLAAYAIAETAAQWYLAGGEPARSLRTAIDADHLDLMDRLVREHGSVLVAHPEDLLLALDRLPGQLRESPERMVLAGFAQHQRGDWTRARELLQQASQGTAFDADMAWRLAQIDYLRGDLDSAHDMCLRGMEHGSPPAAAAICAATAASVRWARGDREGCAELADQALEQAEATGDSRALSMAHTALAMLAAFDGDRRANDAHYTRAIEHAERSGDVAQQMRLRSNRGVHFLKEGAYEQALAEFDAGERHASTRDLAPIAALIKSNRAEVLIRLGRLEEAAVDAGAAVASWELLGSRLIGYGLNRLAQIQALRGDRAAAQASYRRAITAAEAVGEVQSRATALAGLAELLAVDDPQEAQTVVEQMSYRSGTAAVKTRLAATRVALAAGHLDEARSLLAETAVEVEQRRDRVGAAAVAELRARLESDVDAADEAVRLWAELRDPIGLARAELVRARLGDAATAANVAEDVAKRMRDIGCRSLDADIAALRGSAETHGVVTVQALGPFRLVRNAVAVSRSDWQSRKARDLLKILLTRQGRLLPREQAAELLWPDSEGTEATATALKRLNVMVSTLRAVLDPERAFPAAHYLISEDGGLRLNPATVRSDVDGFLALAAEAHRSGTVDRWRAVEAAYTGEFCAEDPYADWAAPMRDQVRLAYMQAASKVADAESESGHFEQAARLWLRLLELDPYHEPAHLALVQVMERAGWRAEARRRYHAYLDVMRQLNLEPSAYPG
ncbi:BTAD domain-containing putative transcriptional regulator [Allorhizocola rhizosphaerae]|uniref:BTAD domain-containing putative transcriptional regulator n=1 Tax=Allorhizocola rhizosphaerae TaxID=1872709 RepID=UPI001B8BB67D|nr:BTAD domain-containing putative transcriptional regulator [Allorhizocola rhizosphaerae]